MTTIRFTGPSYTGFDGHQSVRFDEPGDYQVSDEKAAQLLADFPHQFEAVETAPAAAIAPEATKDSTSEPKPVTAATEPAKEPKKKGK